MDLTLLIESRFWPFGTANGRAYGYKLDVLIKVGDTRATDGKTTLLHYVVHLVEAKYAECLDWMTDLEALPTASKVNSQNLREDMQVMRVGVQKVVDEVEQMEAQQENLDPANKAYLTRMKLFSSSAKKKYNVLTEEMETLTTTFKTLAAKFGEEPETYKWEDFFSLINTFNELWEKAKNDNKKLAQKAGPGKPAPKKLQRSDNSGGIDDIVKQASTGQVPNGQKRDSIRRVRSIRYQNSNNNKQSLSNLLDMLDKMKDPST